MKKIKNNLGKTVVKVKIYGYKNTDIINDAVESGVKLHTVKLKSKVCMVLTVDEKRLEEVTTICKKHRGKAEVIHRQGIGKIFDRYKGRLSLVISSIFFVITIGLLNSVVWEIKVNTANYISPYEVKEILAKEDVKIGMLKKDAHLEAVEKLLKEKCSLSWIDAKIIGGRLIIDIKEKESLSSDIENRKPASLIAKKDGVISRVYASEGEILVEPGDIIKEGDYLVGAIQGKESKEYLVQAEGKVYAKTFYERNELVEKSREVVYRTGKKSIQLYFVVFGKKIYLINNLNKFENYDKIVDNKGFFKKTTYYEVEKQEEKIDDFEAYVKEVQYSMRKDMQKYLPKDSRVLDVVRKCEKENESYRVSVVLVVEEDIALKKNFDKSQINDIMEIVNEKRRIELENWIKQNL